MRRGLFSVKSLPIELTLSILESRGEKELVTQAVWWARLGSNQRPADYESRKKPSDTVQRRRSEYKTSTPTSSNSAVVRQDPSDWQSRLAVNFVYGRWTFCRRPLNRQAASTLVEPGI